MNPLLYWPVLPTAYLYVHSQTNNRTFKVFQKTTFVNKKKTSKSLTKKALPIFRGMKRYFRPFICLFLSFSYPICKHVNDAVYSINIFKNFQEFLIQLFSSCLWKIYLCIVYLCFVEVFGHIKHVFVCPLFVCVI